MRWAREQHELLKLSVLLPLLLLFSVARLHCAAGQHVSETCPVNPFHSLEEPSSCASTYSTSSTAILRDAATQLNISATACPLTVNATNTPTNVDDRPPTSTSATESTVVEVQGTSATESKAYGVPLPSAVRSTKEDVWTEIDDSLGQSWTPELEAEYARAQREFELQTQAAAEPLEFAPTSRPEGASERKDATSVPEFPSFAEWKERHLAAGLAASIQAGKENRKDAKEARSPHIKEVKKLKAEDASNLTKDMEAPADEAPLSNGLDDLLSGSASQPHEGDYGDQLALAPHAQRVYHPVPHAGSGDPLLDPLLSLRDRTNYASFDCSATLIRSSKSTKFASAILSSKKDRYMLSPCSEKEKYVIVELCDEIQIDNIVLANLEFFSSMFKLFRVSGGTAYPESAGSWREIGTFRASNARGMQVFRPPEPSRGGFYRYLRIDFLSHYGSEYYCPVSLLKVYGLTQLDAYRRDEERESRLASADEQDLFAEMEPDLSEQSWEEPVYLQLVEPVKMGAHILEGDEALSVQEESSTDDPNQAVAKDTSHTYAASTTILSSTSLWSLSITVPPSFAKTPEPTEAVDSKTSEIVHAFVDKLQSDDDERRPFPSVARTASATEATNAPRQSSQSLQQDFRSQTSDSRLSQPSPTLEAPSLDNVRPETQSESSKADKAVESSHAAHSSSSTTPHGAPSSLKSSSSSTPSLVYRTVNNAQQQASASPARRNESRPQIIYTHAHHSTHQPNESIYGTIMKRLLALEVNSTLSTTYFEEQSKIVWDTFRRIEDRLLAMEKTRVKDDQLLRRVMLDLELHRARHEAERTELSGQLSVLSREMVMEKRLGIAQLLALVVLMFFVVLTRGSPSSPILSLASQRSATDGPVFPVPSKARRPRSLRDEPLDAFSTLEIRAPTTRERRGLGSGSRGGMLNSANGVLRNTSVKRPYRTSNSITKRPLVGLPMRKNGFEYSASGNPSPLGAPAVSPLSSSAPSESNMQLHLFRRTSRASSPVNGVESVGLHLEDHDLSSSTVTLRGSTPPLYPAAPKNRRSPVETLRRKLKLMQPRRAASLDGANTPETLNDASNKPLAWPSSASDRRKTFNTGHAAFLRDRSETMSSLASEGDEGNSKAWLSTSEDSGDDGHATTPSIGSPSFSDFAKHDVRRSPSRNMPPSPDPSDAETPAANNEALPSTSPAWYPTAK